MAGAATVDLRPDAAPTGAWTSSATGNILGDNNTGTYVSTSSNTNVIGYVGIANPSLANLPANAIVTEIQVSYTARQDVGGNEDIGFGIRFNGGATDAGPLAGQTPNVSNTVFGTLSETYQGTWTRDDVLGLELVYQYLRSGGATLTYIAEAYVTVVWRAPVVATVGATVDPISPTIVSPGDTNVAINGFNLTSTGGGSINSVTIAKTGTATVGALKIYADNGDGVLSQAEIDAGPLGTGTFGSAISIPAQTLSTTPRYYMVAVDIATTPPANDTTTVTGRVSAIGIASGIDSVTNNDTTSLAVTVQRTIVGIGTGTDPTTPTLVSPGDQDIAIDAFTLTKNQGVKTPIVDSVTVTRTGAAAVSAVKIYLDANGNGVLEPGEISAGALGSGSFGSPIAITPQTLSFAKSYIVAVDIAGGATDASAVSGTVTSVGGTYVDAYNAGDNSSLTVTVQHTVVAVGNGSDPSAPIVVSPSDAGIVVDSFTLSKTQGLETPSVTSVTVTKTGAAAVSAVAIYTDANGNGVIDAGDVSIGSGAFDAPIAITPQTIDATKSYLVVVDIDPAAGDGDTVTGRVTAAVGTDVHSFTYADTTSLTVTVLRTVVAVGDGASLTTPVGVSPGDADIVVDSFTLSKTQGAKTPSVTSVTVTKTGAAAVSAVAIYTDANGNGVIDAGDVSIGSGAFDAPIAITPQTIDATKSYLVVVDIDPAAGDGDTVTGRVTAVVGTDAHSFTYADTTSRTLNVVHTVVAVGNGTDPVSPSVVFGGDQDVALDSFALSKTQGLKTPTVTSVTVTKTGAAAVTSVDIYTDANGNGVIDAGDVSIGSGVFDAPIAITPQTIDATKSYLVVVDIDPAAGDGDTVTGRATAAVGTDAHSFTYADTTSLTVTVQQSPSEVTIGNGTADPGPGTVPTIGENGVAVDRFRIERTVGLAPVTVETLTVTRAGSAPVATVRIYTDVDNDGAIAGETALGSAAFSGSTATIDIVDQAAGAVGSPAYYIMVCDFGVGSDGQTASVSVTGATGTGLPGVNFTFSDTANTFTMRADSQPPTDPGDVTATPGAAAPVIATLSWLPSTDDMGVAGYRVYRAVSADGDYVVIATTLDTTFADQNGVPGQEYWYRVSAFDAVGNESTQVLATGTPVTATWTQLPHTTYTRDTNLCKICHVPHIAASARKIFRDTGASPAELAVCYACHDGSGASTNVKTGAANSFVGTSGHALEAVPAEADADLTNACASCHGPHGDVATRSMIPRSTVNGTTIDAAGNDWCGACHDDAASWYKPGGYAALLTNPSRDATGYPVAGTYPGPTVYADPVKNPHSTIPADTIPSPMVPTATVDRVQGDCLWCHASHRSSAPYDGLIDEFRPSTASTLVDDQDNGTYAALCFSCHDGDAGWVAKGAADIKTHVTAGGPRSGHRIESTSDLYPTGAPLPCYECHNPHGSSASKGGLLVMTMTDGTTSVLLGDSVGEIDVSTPEGVRRFCFSCHTTAGNVSGGDGLAYGWNGSVYAQVSDASAQVAGVSRIAYDPINKRGLKIPPVNGHYRDNMDSCSKCHGNIHNPSPGLSDGGVPCYGCHSAYQSPMEDNLGAAKGGPERLTVYHHVMGSSTLDGDIAPGPGGTYPSFSVMTSDVFCVSCHVDHDLFNATPGANLRLNLATNPTVGANSDFVATEADGGICTSCHQITLAKDVTDQKPGTALSQKVDPGAYQVSAHQYQVSSEFGAGNTFYADCSKCHNDEQAKEFATSPFKFGTHWSESSRIISAFGGTVAEDLGEAHCYGCHTGATAGNDYFGARAMTAAARGTEAEFALAGSTHDLSKVACVNCHNVHKASATSPVADPDNTYNVVSLATPADNTAFCVKCHDGSAPAQTINGTTLVPYTVTAGSRANVAANYATTGHGKDAVACRTCHEQHGSTLPKLLATTVDGQNIPAYSDTADQAQCLACHRAGGAAGSANIAQYYPTTAYGTATQANSPIWTRFGHRIVNGPNAGSAMPCRSCHNPHGSAGSGYMLAVRTQVAAGVDTVIGLTAGQLVMEDSTQIPANANNVRRFCFTCHTASDNSQGWNGSAMAVVPAGAQVMGISRTGGLLKLPVLPNGVLGHASGHTTYSCYLCHGDDFTASNSVNVHNPASGESRGGIPCYVCHTVYRDQMEDGTGSQIGASRQLTYHHVLGSAARDGDSITYPALTADGRENVYCLSCHVDHDKFSPFVNAANQRSRNLRSAYDNLAATAANSDWNVTSGGVCLGCHSVELTRDNTNQKAEVNSTRTPAIGPAGYATSAHQYVATSTFTDGSTFNGNCVKCHDSEIDGGGMERGKSTTGFQTSANKFSVHSSGNRRILAAMGLPQVDPLAEERVCYACHSLAGQGFKATANRDWYNAVPMNAPSQAIYGLFTTKTYTHNVGGYTDIHRPSPTDETLLYNSANKHVECADCHGVHSSANSRHAQGTNAVSGAISGASGAVPTYTANSNWAAPTGYTLTANASAEYQICFKCHSGANTSLDTYDGVTGDSALNWTDVGLEFNPNNGSYHPVVAALPATDPSKTYGSSQLYNANQLRASWSLNGWTAGGWTRGQTMYCSDCHISDDAASFGPHGSGTKWMLRGPNQAWPYNSRALNGTNGNTNFATLPNATSGPDGVFCLNCHTLTNIGNVHGTTDKHGGNSRGCVMCHVRVPHGSKASRLLAVYGSNTGYPGTMPRRYTPNGLGTTTMSYLTGYTKGTGAPGIGTCTTNNCGTHSTTPLATSDARW